MSGLLMGERLGGRPSSTVGRTPACRSLCVSAAILARATAVAGTYAAATHGGTILRCGGPPTTAPMALRRTAHVRTPRWRREVTG
jgi:hypothetical protein